MMGKNEIHEKFFSLPSISCASPLCEGWMDETTKGEGKTFTSINYEEDFFHNFQRYFRMCLLSTKKKFHLREKFSSTARNSC